MPGTLTIKPDQQRARIPLVFRDGTGSEVEPPPGGQVGSSDPHIVTAVLSEDGESVEVTRVADGTADVSYTNGSVTDVVTVTSGAAQPASVEMMAEHATFDGGGQHYGEEDQRRGYGEQRPGEEGSQQRPYYGGRRGTDQQDENTGPMRRGDGASVQEEGAVAQRPGATESAQEVGTAAAVPGTAAASQVAGETVTQSAEATQSGETTQASGEAVPAKETATEA